MWNNDYVRKFFFAAGEDEAKSDELFLERYCSQRTRDHMELHSIKPADLRKTLSRLAPLAPDFDHSTPKWSFTGGNRLLVCIGRARLEERNQRRVPVIRQPRFGLCACEGNIYFWTDAKLTCEADLNQPSYLGFQSGHWVFWEHSQNKCYFKEPLAGPGAREKALDLLDDNQPLWNLIQEIEDDIEIKSKDKCEGKVPPKSFLISKASESIQTQLGVPEEITVFYPRLIDDGITAATRPQPEVAPVRKRAVQADSKEKNREEIKERTLPMKEAPSPALEPNHAHKNELLEKRPSPEPDLPDRAELLSTVETQSQELQLPAHRDARLTEAPNIAGRYYVYVLKDPEKDQPFYVGKGAYDRALQHFRAIGPNEEGIATEGEENQNELKIGMLPGDILDEEALRTGGNERARGTDTAQPVPKIGKIQELLDRGVPRDDIPRVVARGLSEQAAFTLEALMIKGVYGMENLSNSARGHHDERFRGFGDWEYRDGYDLPEKDGELLDDVPQHDLGSYYVYVLRDPITHEIFYVGKGKAGRLCQHFAMARNQQAFNDLPRIQRLKTLLDAGNKPKAIGFIVARVADEAMAFVIESFYMKFVVGFDQLTNVQAGHLYGMFRSRRDWKKRHGFDLPTHAGGMRKLLLDTYLGEGLDTILAEVVEHPEVAALLANTPSPNLEGAGELACLGQIRGVDQVVSIRIQVRCARRIQILLLPRGNAGRQWMQERFGNLGLYPLHRRDDLFIPLCWRGATNVTTSTEEAVKRAIRLARLAQTLQVARTRQELAEFDDLLVGLPRPSPAG